MDEFKKFDVDGNGTIDQSEWDRMALEDRRLRMQDEDAQRDAQRRMTWYALSGMLLYPFAVILADVFGLTRSRQNIRINGVYLFCICCWHCISIFWS